MSDDIETENQDKDKEVRRIATIWCNAPSDLPPPEKLKRISEIFYDYRNPPSERENPEKFAEWKKRFSSIPSEMLSTDPEITAAVEHYFYARGNVATGEYSSDNMRIFVHAYQLAKRFPIVDLRHNKNNPTTRPSELQKVWALLGADQGGQDLITANLARKRNKQTEIEPPKFRMPPNFTGKYGANKTQNIKY